MFTFPEKRRQGFFLLPETLVGKEDGNGPYSALWSRLTPSSRAVLLVLGSHVNGEGLAFPSEERIAGFAGLSRKTVRQALTSLESEKVIEIHSYVSRQGRRCKKHLWRLSRVGEGSMRFFHSMLDGGIWRKLTPSAKSLYLAFRYFGRARPDLDPDFDEEEYNYGAFLSADAEEGAGEDWCKYLQERAVDFCNAEPQILCEFAGVSRRRFNDAVASLGKIKLVTGFDSEYWKVAVRPPEIWKADFLNQELLDKGGVK